jgi:hypothetical protein
MQSLVLRLGIALAAVFALAIAISPAPATAGNAYFSYGYSNEDIYSVPCASGSRTPTITRFVQRPWGTDKGIASDGTYLYPDRRHDALPAAPEHPLPDSERRHGQREHDQA